MNVVAGQAAPALGHLLSTVPSLQGLDLTGLNLQSEHYRMALTRPLELLSVAANPPDFADCEPLKSAMSQGTLIVSAGQCAEACGGRVRVVQDAPALDAAFRRRFWDPGYRGGL